METELMDDLNLCKHVGHFGIARWACGCVWHDDGWVCCQVISPCAAHREEVEFFKKKKKDRAKIYNPKNDPLICSQCGHEWTYAACGPAHAVIFMDIKETRQALRQKKKKR